jgi:hypothetical protein
MGMFDIVIVQCPDCTKPVEFQSKKGCCLTRHSLLKVPVEIAEDICKKIETCRFCGCEVIVQIADPVVEHVTMTVTKRV